VKTFQVKVLFSLMLKLENWPNPRSRVSACGSLTAVDRLGKRLQNESLDPTNAVSDRVYRRRRPGQPS
jgi:hypothetical protein